METRKLDAIEVHGHRGHVEDQSTTMADWHR